MTKFSANKGQKVITRRMRTMLTVIIARDIRKKMSLFKSQLIKITNGLDMSGQQSQAEVFEITHKQEVLGEEAWVSKMEVWINKKMTLV